MNNVLPEIQANPELVDVTSLGNRVFADVIKLSSSKMTGILMREKFGHRHTGDVKVPGYGAEGRNAPTSEECPGLPATTTSYRFFSWSLQSAWPS